MTGNDYSARNIALGGMFIALMSVAAWVKIDTGIISITFQLIVAVISGIVLGPKIGPLSMVAYMFLGLAGLPIFTSGGGIGYFAQPSMGFIMSFPATSYVAAVFWNNLWWRRILAILLSIVVSYAIGIAWMLVWSITIGETILTFWGIMTSWGFAFLLKDIGLGVVLFITAFTLDKLLPKSEDSNIS
ncbi:MAG TPA: biotin transporter BioY [Caldisericia bacterium]|nr:biotin transporter BioY [Caldisericia bacterium]HPF49082.1 biotin transporter BioY [Caldisericia bacterium]HPI83054.1 biotin transporter BioY [Caldisericia bacterium]HPQ92281.1 biotin transporter BioY [Caldisericia bacterium]HRV74621.1 biotin transporter BioY [Caldisericia bacterium]